MTQLLIITPSPFSLPLRWFSGRIKREVAEKQLMSPVNSYGSYLVRIDCESTPEKYALSVRDRDQVKHYQINQSENGDFFVAAIASSTFKILQDLVTHYQQHADGLCVNLKKPCAIPTDISGQVIDEWQIDRINIRLVKKLAADEFIEVWEGMWNKITPITVKTFKPNHMTSVHDFLQSINLMKKLRHPKLVQLYALCSMEEPVFIITEFMEHGSLVDYLRGEGRRSLKLPQLIDMAAQVAAGMAYLEEKNVIHRDLAARNILVGEGVSCKVANFKLARVMDKSFYKGQEGEKIRIKWAAPEALLYRMFSIKSDIWSFGIVLWEIITYGRIPYPGMNNAQVNEQILQGYRMPQPPGYGYPDKLYNIMLNCWREEPTNRHTFETLQWQLEDFFIDNDRRY